MIFRASITTPGGTDGVILEEGSSASGQIGYEVGRTDDSGAYCEYVGFFGDYASARDAAVGALQLLVGETVLHLEQYAQFAVLPEAIL